MTHFYEKKKKVGMKESIKCQSLPANDPVIVDDQELKYRDGDTKLFDS